MVDQKLLHRSLSHFARTLVQRYAVGDVLYELSEHVLGVLDIEAAGVSLDDGTGQMRFVTAINEASARMEQAQEQAQCGPCVDAFRSGEVVVVNDLAAHAERWPEFAAAAFAEGFHSIAAIPMRLDGTRLGALNLYRMAAHEWEEDEVEAASLFADMATATSSTPMSSNAPALRSPSSSGPWRAASSSSRPKALSPPNTRCR